MIAPLQLARSIAELWPSRRIPDRKLIDLSRYGVQQPAWAIRGDALDRCRIRPGTTCSPVGTPAAISRRACSMFSFRGMARSPTSM